MNENNNSPVSFLKGHLLIAMPQMSDPRFHKSVIFLCEHDQKSAMGMVINKPLPSPDFAGILTQVGVSTDDRPLEEKIKRMPVLSGGPVQSNHGFLLHSPDFSQKDTIRINDLFSISGTVESLRAIVNGYRPEKMLFAFGYAGWGPGQLEKELQENAWMTAPADYEIVFGTAPEDMWEKSFAILGIRPEMISGVSGRA